MSPRRTIEELADIEEEIADNFDEMMKIIRPKNLKMVTLAEAFPELL